MTLTPKAVSPYDERPLISDLLTKHSAAIDSVRQIIQADDVGNKLYNKGDNAKRYDDIWILRFVLSHNGNVTAAAKAVLKTIEFREEKKMNELGDIRHRLQNFGDSRHSNSACEPLPGFPQMNSCCGENCSFIVLPDVNRGLILYCDVGQVDMDKIADEVSEENQMDSLLYSNEATFQVLDDVTRRTGRLTKQLKMIDMGNVSVRKMNRAYLKRDAACSKALEDYYPQQLGTMFVANGPAWLSTFWSALRPFFPKRMVEKVDFLPSISKIKKAKNSDKYLKPILRYVSEEDLPERYGGKNQEWPLPNPGHYFGTSAK